MTENIPLTKILMRFIDQSSGWFSLQSIYNELTIYSKNDKELIRKQCSLYTKNGILERDYKVNGKYRRVHDDLVEMDLYSTEEAVGLDIKYPFGLERVFKTLPHSILVCAGASNAGKTGFMLDFCLLNHLKHHVIYFSSEMGASRLKSRLAKHPTYRREGAGFQAFERGENFHDVIGRFPDSIIVVDYLEIYENFYEIGQKIKLIFDAMKGNTVVFIAVQKNPSRKNIKGQTEYVDLGRGGNFGLEKASLYIAMDGQGENGMSRLKIVKAKEWQDERINPNNLEFQYKLVNGCQFVNIVEPSGIPPYKQQDLKF